MAILTGTHPIRHLPARIPARETEGEQGARADLELWRQHHEQLMQEAERGRLVRELRATRRRALSRPGGRASEPAGRFVGHMLAVLRVPREKARC